MIISPKNKSVELCNSFKSYGGSRNEYYYKIFNYLQYELQEDFKIAE